MFNTVLDPFVGCYKIFFKSQHMIKSWVETNNCFYYQLIRQLFSWFINSYGLKNVKRFWSSPSQSPSWNLPSQQKQLKFLSDIWRKVPFSRSNANWHVRTNADMAWHGMFSACELVTEYQIQNNRMWEEASRKSSQTLLWNIPRSHFLDGQTAGR